MKYIVLYVLVLQTFLPATVLAQEDLSRIDRRMDALEDQLTKMRSQNRSYFLQTRRKDKQLRQLLKENNQRMDSLVEKQKNISGSIDRLADSLYAVQKKMDTNQYQQQQQFKHVAQVLHKWEQAFLWGGGAVIVLGVGLAGFILIYFRRKLHALKQEMAASGEATIRENDHTRNVLSQKLYDTYEGLDDEISKTRKKLKKRIKKRK